MKADNLNAPFMLSDIGASYCDWLIDWHDKATSVIAMNDGIGMESEADVQTNRLCMITGIIAPYKCL